MKKSRISQHGTLLVALTSAQGLLATPALAVSDYTITASQSDIQISNDYVSIHITDLSTVTGEQMPALSVMQNVLVGTLENAGIITSTDSSALNVDGSIDNINNSGVIGSNGNAADSVYLSVTSQVGALVNSGTITGSTNNLYTGSNSAAINNAGVINSLTNTQSGTIDGYTAINNTGQIDVLNNAGTIRMNNNSSGYYYQTAAVLNQGTIATFNNTGLIDSNNSSNNYNESAVLNQGTINTLINDGTITSNYIAVQNQGAIGTFTNNGEISGAVVGVYNNHYNNNSINTANGDIVNNGLISSATYAIYNDDYGNTDTSVNIVNTGRITGNNYAIRNGAYGNTSATPMTIVNSGIIKGNISNSSSLPLIIEGGNDKAGILTGINGVGQIENLNGDVIFSTGRLLLDDHIMTNGTVNNNAASLQINNNIEITGNYHQGSNAALIVGVADTAVANGSSADTGYGRLIVSGSANIDAGSGVSLARTGNTYQFAAGQRYVVIDANSTDTNYNAGQLRYQAAGYAGAATGSTYNADGHSALVVTLQEPVTPPPTTTPTDPATPVTPTQPDPDPTAPTDPTTPGTSDPTPTAPTTPTTPEPTAKPGWATIPNATAALGGLGHYSGISPQLLELYNASLAIADQKEANRVGERLSASQNINTSTATNVATMTAMSVVTTHMDTARNPQTAGLSGVSTGDAYSDWILWGQPFGGYARQDSTSNVSGYSAKFGGLIIGADRALGDNWRVGGAVNYSNTSVHGKDNLSGNTSTADNYGLIGYAGYTGNPWYVNLSAGVNRQNYDSIRRADFTGFSGSAQGKFNGQSITLQSEFGYPLTLPAEVIVTPLAALAYSYQHVDGYNETGGNGMALDVSSSHTQSVESNIGARLEKTFDTGLGNLTPYAQVSWIHQYDNNETRSTATYAADTVGETSFTSRGVAPVEDMAGVAIGSTLYDANDLSLDARYDLQAGERYQAHTFSLRLRKMF
ncbi:autotransporter outer membrane beta-barrel domain-containing protein [Cedecea colo]|uniref:Autotransporter domain-containing protein n=1 Tax=Cedecea colo TaxID=2552946 RepID=A0ABX0VRW1_9ENTR|nr:autotransporter outer membrane beta-barrel domain-containing protein [Cedecea colo]NIY49335.1 autotransporter domain-containing protein [Cedecea colo]